MADTKDRIMQASAELFRRQGYHGTGMKQIGAEANAPFGSLYHFFPGGKEQLGDEVIRWSGAVYRELVGSVFAAAPDVVTGLRDVFAAAARLLREGDYADVCPVATLAVEISSTHDSLRRAAADVFESWLEASVARFEAAGIDDVRARELAVFALSTMQGALILARASRTTEAVEVAGALVADVVAAELPKRRRASVS